MINIEKVSTLSLKCSKIFISKTKLPVQNLRLVLPQFNTEEFPKVKEKEDKRNHNHRSVYCFLKMELNRCQVVNQPLQGINLQEKVKDKDKYRKAVQKEPKAIYIAGQKKAFCRQRLPEPSCVEKGNAKTDILITFAQLEPLTL